MEASEVENEFMPFYLLEYPGNMTEEDEQNFRTMTDKNFGHYFFKKEKLRRKSTNLYDD